MNLNKFISLLMESLNSLYHFIISYNIDNMSVIKKTWYFYDVNNILKYLQYECKVREIEVKVNSNPVENKLIKEIDELYTIHEINNLKVHDINLELWLKENFSLLKQSHENYLNSMNIINYITNELGKNTYSTTYEIGWSINNFYNLCIDLFSTTISLNYKNKTMILTESKLNTFIKKNKTLILKKQQELKQQKLKLQELKPQELKPQSKNEIISKPNPIKTEILDKSLKQNFYIIKPLKERYKIQSNKSLPVKYEWEN